jgi:UrcA family protein
MARKPLSLIVAGIATLSVAGAAFAATAGEPLSARVRYDDLNLSSDAGVAHLYARLRHAATDVCQFNSFHDVVDQRCAATALDNAVASVDNSKLTSLHARASGMAQVAANGG